MTLAKLALALTIVGTTSTVIAQPEAEPDEAYAKLLQEYEIDNAALLYYRYWMLGELALRSEFFMNEYTAQPGWRPSPEFSESLIEAQPAIAGFLKASMIEEADWGVEVDEGINALLPHLGKLRQTARLLSADARRLMEEGNGDEAGARVAALIRMGEQLDHDPVLISALVGIAIIARGNAEAEELVASDELTADARDIILDAMDAIDLDNPAGVRGAVMGERDIFLRGTVRRYTGPTAGADFVKEMFPLVEGSDAELPPWTAVAFGFDGAQLRADIKKAERFYDDILSIWDLPDAGDRIDQLSTLIVTGHYGVAGRMLLPAMGKVWESSQRIRRELIETRKLLEDAPVVVKEEQSEDED